MKPMTRPVMEMLAHAMAERYSMPATLLYRLQPLGEHAAVITGYNLAQIVKSTRGNRYPRDPAAQELVFTHRALVLEYLDDRPEWSTFTNQLTLGICRHGHGHGAGYVYLADTYEHYTASKLADSLPHSVNFRARWAVVTGLGYTNPDHLLPFNACVAIGLAVRLVAFEMGHRYITGIDGSTLLHHVRQHLPYLIPSEATPHVVPA